ncbi:MAG: glycogen/starch/alpha-glucan phosphorylase [Stomatobaculum sp.]|nr:glycogen/starch/alpha-glucan phosphorylase [Stomatobaculum sp.]
MSKDKLKDNIESFLRMVYRKTIQEANPAMVYHAVALAVKDTVINDWILTHRTYDEKQVKKLYYMSMEFLVGRALGNTILALGQQKIVKEALQELGYDLVNIEDEERDPALGNGGLGRLAACFLDSLSTLNYPAYGCGIRYHYGMFRQKIENGYQIEIPDDWLKNGYPFEIKREEYACEVKFGGHVRSQMGDDGRTHYHQENYSSVRAIPYDLPIVGYGNNMVNTLRIWDAEATSKFSLESFDKGEYQKAVEEQNLAHTISEVLYPNDNNYSGKELRLKQQYFFISATLQTAIKKFHKRHSDIRELPKYAVFQMNDTHPTVAVPELMRILVDEERLEWDQAWDIVTHCCAYTNHTIMSEALEKWPIELFSRLLPRVYMIVEEINRRFLLDVQKVFPGDTDKANRMAIIHNGQVHMAYMACCAAFSINGVAAIHTEILKKQTLKDFFDMYPYKFNNKTNGITQRRFLLHGNPLLADWITSKIGSEWITDLPAIKKLELYVNDPQCQHEFMNIKYRNKLRLAEYIKQHNGIDVNPRSIFDVQVKRLHEYKRQLMNILHVMFLYNQLKDNPHMDMVPRTFIFGAKAAAGYRRAKLTIKLINSVAEVINNDYSINGKIKVVFIEDYCVSNAEIIFAAADVSEQISTASKEASGTSNMKFMLNGAPTLGTMDGANIEIVQEVGQDNAFIFGLSAEEVMNFEKHGGYNPMEIFNSDQDIRRVLMQLINGFYSPDDPERFREIYNSLLHQNGSERADTYFILKDLRSYIDAYWRIDGAYRDEVRWAKMCMLNTANAGKFSSDRTIEDYVRDIWHLKKVKIEADK